MTTALFAPAALPSEPTRLPLTPARAIGPDLCQILARKDDRLLRDIGLTREDILGPEETWWAAQRRTRDTWNL